MNKTVKRLLIMVALLYGVMLALFMFFESSLMYPAPDPANANWEPDGIEFEDAQFVSKDGTALHGWFFAHPEPRAVILFAHGNGEQVAWLGKEMSVLSKLYRVSIFAFDWRGYGKSGGKPDEAGILEDAEAAQLWLSERTSVAPEKIVLWGRSIGGAVAVHLAAEFGTKGLILDRTFNSMVDVAASHMPWLPVRTFLKNRYQSDERITRYEGPLIQFHGKPDRVVPFKTGRALFDAAVSNDKQFIVSEQLGHNDHWPEELHRAVDLFIDSL